MVSGFDGMYTGKTSGVVIGSAIFSKINKLIRVTVRSL